MDAYQEVWDKLNRKLSNLCDEGEITEEEMESILDECQLMEPHELEAYWENHWSRGGGY